MPLLHIANRLGNFARFNKMLWLIGLPLMGMVGRLL